MAKLDSDAADQPSDGWLALLDELLVGVTHNISNRVATLAGVSDILSGDPTVPPILRALADEVPRLEEALRLLRLLAGPVNEPEEALEPYRSLADAMALAALHPACRDVHFTFTDGGDVPPIVAPPIGLTHALVAALVSAAADARAEEASSDGAGVDGAGADGAGATTRAASGHSTHRDMILMPVRFSVEGAEVVISAGEHSVRAPKLGG